MDFLLKRFDKWAEVETDSLSALIDKHYGPLMYLAMVFPSWKRSALPKTFAIFGLQFFCLVLHFAMLTGGMILLRDDFEQASLIFQYWLIFAFLIVTLSFLNKQRGIIALIHQLQTSDIGLYKAGRIYADKEILVIQENIEKVFVRFLFLPGLIVMLAGGVLAVPYMKKFNNPPHYTPEGMNLNLPISLYYPFKTDRGIFHLIAVAGQLMAAGSAAVIVVTMEIFLFRISYVVIFEYKVLQHAVSTVLKRAKRLYKITYLEEKSRKCDIHNKNYQKCIAVCFKDIVTHHYRIGDLIRGLEQIFKWPGAIAYMFGTGAIGLSLVNIMVAKKAGNYENIALFGLLAIGEILNMYILSAFGEDITTESEVLRNVLYDIDWYKLNVHNRKIMLNIQVGITNPVIFRAGGIVALSMDTFSSIINTAYSFFNLLNAQ